MKQNRTSTSYYFLDILKLLFACLIPLLHMKYGGGPKLGIMQEYISRLGVPFFFTVTGLLLERKLRQSGHQRAVMVDMDDPLPDRVNTGKKAAWKSGLAFISRAAFLLGFWAVIDLPLDFILHVDIHDSLQVIQFIKEALFMTQGYLWYLTALILGEFIYCFLRINLRLDVWKVMIITGILYIIGVLGNSWSLAAHLFPAWYYDLFLTTRNGLFFAPMMLVTGATICDIAPDCLIGNAPDSRTAKSWKNESWTEYPPELFVTIVLSICSIILFILEVRYIRQDITGEFDSSMYFTLPLIEYCIVRWGMVIPVPGRLHRFCRFARQLSVVIYCSQYICITAGYYLFYFTEIKAKYILLQYAILIPFSILLLIIIKKSRIRWLQKLL